MITYTVTFDDYLIVPLHFNRFQKKIRKLPFDVIHVTSIVNGNEPSKRMNHLPTNDIVSIKLRVHFPASLQKRLDINIRWINPRQKKKSITHGRITSLEAGLVRNQTIVLIRLVGSHHCLFEKQTIFPP